MKHSIPATALFFICILLAAEAKAQAVNTGYLDISILIPPESQGSVDSFFVAVESDFDNAIKFALEDTLTLPAGNYELTFFQKYFVDVQFSATIIENKFSKYSIHAMRFTQPERQKYRSSFPRYFWKGSDFVFTDPDTEIFFKGENRGVGVTKLDSTGNKRIRINGLAYNGDRFSRTFKAKSEFQIFEMYYRPKKRKTYALSFVPGAAQIYKRQQTKGIILGAAFLGTAATAYYLNNTYQDEHSTYRSLRRKYYEETDPLKAFEMGNRAAQQLDEAKKTLRIRNYVLAGLSALYIYNVIDGLRKPEIGYRRTKLNFDPYLDFGGNVTSVNIKVTGRF